LSVLLWCLGVYLVSAFIIIRVAKSDGGEVKEDDLKFILIPAFNTLMAILVLGVGACEWIGKVIKSANFDWFRNAYKCFKESLIRGLNKL
jgi:hypothetical protein